MSAFNPQRRQFLKASAVTGGGIMLGFTLGPLSVATAGQADDEFQPNAFLQITPHNQVIFHCPRDEMGQGITTGLGTLIAEELDVEPWALKIERPTVNKAFINPAFGIQGTGGSTAIKAHYLPLRQVGANVRAVILQAAARDLGVAQDALRTDAGHVLHGDASYPYSQFLATAVELEVPEQAPLKDKQAFKYIGKDFPRLDAVEKSTGTAVFSIDIEVPGMHHAVVARSPVAGGQLKAMDADAARAMPGVSAVLAISSGAAVVAEHFWQAKQAAQKLQLAWDLPALAEVSTPQIKADFTAALEAGDAVTRDREGDTGKALEGASAVVDSNYWTPYLAHAPMEPMNAVVRVENGEAEVWSGTQGPVADQGLVARALGIDKDKVKVHTTYMGGGFGRRGTLTHVVEAAEVAAATGRPIHLVWTREDDMRHGVYRPASLMRIRAAVDSQGMISSWEATRVGGNLMPTTLSNQLPALLPGFVPQGLINFAVGAAEGVFENWKVDEGSIEGIYEDYDFPNRDIKHITVDHGLPLTFWRSVGHSYTAFAKETMLDELAEKSGQDPVTLRLNHTRGNPRLAKVIRIAGDSMQAAEPTPGRALGIAAHGSFFSYVAQVAEASVDRGRIRVHKVTCVVDCGQVVNPDVVRAQMEGSIMFGLTAALYGNLELENGRIRQGNFNDYPILRMNEAPEVEVIIVDSDQPPTGAGEPGLPPIAPAVANAVYAASGQRLRSLPLQPA